jgi:hypothetical protein
MQVIDAFESAGGEAVRLPGGEFVDVPVAELNASFAGGCAAVRYG